MHAQNNTHTWRPLSATEFAALGLQNVAYIKPKALDNGRVRYAIHTADGAEVAVVAGRDVALATVRQNDMEPLSVH
jgi:hypothetical protein